MRQRVLGQPHGGADQQAGGHFAPAEGQVDDDQQRQINEPELAPEKRQVNLQEQGDHHDRHAHARA